mmetsp:Transcript_11578/g.20917  ORF Transcript_11578/g.20917 Transcript_11578/m.20917 type:complete len:572 (-) Transcript_11578:317-2032(-)
MYADAALRQPHLRQVAGLTSATRTLRTAMPSHGLSSSSQPDAGEPGSAADPRAQRRAELSERFRRKAPIRAVLLLLSRAKTARHPVVWCALAAGIVAWLGFRWAQRRWRSREAPSSPDRGLEEGPTPTPAAPQEAVPEPAPGVSGAVGGPVSAMAVGTFSGLKDPADSGPSQGNLFLSISNRWAVGWQSLRQDPWTYALIPVSAAFVGWFTNWLAVKMIFYPLEFRGVPLWVRPGEPLGLIGWRGIVPAKSAKMANKMVDVTISQLLSVKELFARLDPRVLAQFLMPSVVRTVPGGRLGRPLLFPFVRRTARHIVRNVEQVLDVNELVVKKFTARTDTMGALFQRVGGKELAFLVNSGTYLGFLLGLLQMVAWILYPARWTMPVAGAVVGTATNWIALKWIFEPVRPVPFGPFTIQGMFLKRQSEVSDDFCAFVSAEALTSQTVWHEILHGKGAARFKEMMDEKVPLPKGMTQAIFEGIQADVGSGLPAPMHNYCDATLDVEATLCQQMKLLSPEGFEQVLHPIFQEDEIILILAGGFLGGLTGWLQMKLDIYLEARRQIKAELEEEGGSA